VIGLPVGAAVALTIAAYLVLFGCAELLRRAVGMSGSTSRRIVHVAGGLVALAIPLLFDSATPVVALAVGFVVFMLATRRAGLLGSIHDVPRRTWGAEAFPLGIAAAFAITGGAAPAYPAAFLALALGDAVAGVVGARAGRTRYRLGGDARSLEGSLAMFGVVAVGGAVADMAVGTRAIEALGFGAMVAAIATAAEAVSARGTDNLSVPVAAALAGVWLVHPLVGPVVLGVAVAVLVAVVLGGLLGRLTERSAISPELEADDG
jgi:dolichol kinase